MSSGCARPPGVAAAHLKDHGVPIDLGPAGAFPVVVPAVYLLTLE